MRLVLTAAGVLIGLSLVGISATLSFLFCSSLGGTETESKAYGSAAAGLDILKALAPFYAAWHWRNRQWVGVGAAILLWTVAVTVSVSSAMGLAAQNRLGKSAEHATRHLAYRETEAQLQTTQRKLAAMPAARSAPEVEADLQALFARPITIGKRVRTVALHTDHCARPDKLTATMCTEISSLKIELARATERSRIESEIKRLRDRIDQLRKGEGGEGNDIDHQASIIASTLNAVTGIAATVPAVQMALIALIALAIEVGGSCSLYAAIGSHTFQKPAKRQPEPAAPDDATPPSGSTRDYCDARLRTQDGARLAMRQIHQDYEAWCLAQDLEPKPRTNFLRELRQEGEGRGWSMAGGVIHHVCLV